MYRWFSWGVASLPEGKGQGVHLVQLCAKYRPYRKLQEAVSPLFVSTSSMSVSLTVQCSNTVSKLLYTPVNLCCFFCCCFFLPADVAGSSQPCPSWRVRVWEHNNSLWPHSDTLKGGRVWRRLCSGGRCSGACRPGWVGCVDVCVYIVYLLPAVCLCDCDQQ